MIKKLDLKKIDIWQIGIIIIFIFSLYLHFTNLTDALILDSDEARAFRYLSSGPILTFMCSPFMYVRSFAFPFYVSACLGFLNILLLYFILKDVFDRKIVFFTIALYAFFPFRMNFARTLMPPVYTEFFFLSSLLFIVKSFKNKRANLMFFAGACGALGFFAHSYSVYMILGLFIASLSMCFMLKEKKFILTYGLRYLVTFIVCCIALHYFFYIIANKYNYFQSLKELHERMNTVGCLTPEFVRDRMSWFFSTLLDKTTNSGHVILRTIFVISGCLGGIFLAFKKKDKWLIFFILAGFPSIILFVTLSALKCHSMCYRHFIWLGSIISLCIGFFIAWLYERFKQRNSQKAVIVIFGLFILSSFFISYKVTEETFKNTEIRQWFLEEEIPFYSIIRLNITINTFEDKVFAQYIPGCYINETSMDTEFKIAWPLMYKKYLEGKFRYMMTSGIGRHQHVGENELFLKNVEPLKSWESPFTKFKYRFFEKENRDDKLMIEVYDLNDVFSKQNFIYIAKEDKAFFKRFRKASKENKKIALY